MREVKIYYGPYESNGLIRHKPQKLHGIIDRLKKMRYEVELIPISRLERVVVKIKGYVIASCNITLLLFNMHCYEDTTCIKFLKIVKEAGKRLYNEKNIKKNPDIGQDLRFLTKMDYAKTTCDLFLNSPML